MKDRKSTEETLEYSDESAEQTQLRAYV